MLSVVYAECRHAECRGAPKKASTLKEQAQDGDLPERGSSEIKKEKIILFFFLKEPKQCESIGTMS
jgi:hypothetical protein